jgi:glycosyltransferase involved in cell wall biosynthesis
MSLSILFVHQGFELYGSDRTLIQSVQAAATRWPDARITVLLPRDGALKAALLAVVADVRIADLAILRKSSLRYIRPRHAIGLVRKIVRARRMMQSYDVSYINTIMVLDYVLASWFVRRARIVHVHEIPVGSAALIFSALLAWSRGFLIFNSLATRHSFWIPFWQHWAMVWNGVPERRVPLDSLPHTTLNLLLIGRFNAWKGQSLLLRAVAGLPAESRSRLKVRLVGGVFRDQVHFRDDLSRIVEECGLSEAVEMIPFAPDPSAHYAWADIVVVPSTKPEPFGLVAIEGMRAGRAVIAADHGGLSEIVVDGVTGSLVVPGSAASLAAALLRYIEQPRRTKVEGEAGRRRFAAEFEESDYKRKITQIIGHLAKPSEACGSKVTC